MYTCIHLYIYIYVIFTSTCSLSIWKPFAPQCPDPTSTADVCDCGNSVAQHPDCHIVYGITIGKPEENGLMGFDGVYPLVISHSY